eukprot:11232323-Ditylum_brightwellii.AAC.1
MVPECCKPVGQPITHIVSRLVPIPDPFTEWSRNAIPLPGHCGRFCLQSMHSQGRAGEGVATPCI